MPRNTDVTALFSEEMKGDTLTTSIVELTDKFTKKKVPASVSCDSPCRTVTLDPYPSDPSKGLAKNTKYEVSINTRVTDASGNALSERKTWTFTTGST